MNFETIYIAIIGAISSGIAYIVKFILNLFKEKNKEIKTLGEKNTTLEINKARMEERLVKKFHSTGKKKD